MFLCFSKHFCCIDSEKDGVVITSYKLDLIDSENDHVVVTSNKLDLSSNIKLPKNSTSYQ